MKKSLFILFLFGCFYASATEPASKLFVDLQKLQSLDRVLYIAAHPDDENTRALAWFSLGEKAETAYLSLTRGDGGQNLIGNELSEQLGVLRTQELLAARSYDGASQYFTRAVDFGYSKSADESFDKWGKDALLSDVVLMIRKFKPDVIVTRFPPDERAGHGHHTASAMLAIEAFEKAADKNYLPNQVAKYGTWQTTSLYWNASNWWNKNIDKEAKDNPNFLVADIGGYNALLGQSYNEIGTIARSQHKCQGFGAIVERGSRMEYFEHLKGEKLSETFFEKNNKSWSKIIDKNFEKKLNDLVSNFDFSKPENNVAELIELKKSLDKLPDSFFKNEKLKRCTILILNCLGLHAELLATDFVYQNSNSEFFSLELLNRSEIPVSVVLDGKTTKLEQNKPFSSVIQVQNTNAISNPYWLNEPFTTLFKVEDENNLLRPESFASFSKEITLLVANETVNIPLDGTYKWRIPSYGEKSRAVIKTPTFSVNFDQKTAILKPGAEKTIKLKIHSFTDKLNDKLTLQLPEGWKANQTEFDISLDKIHEEKWLEITLQSTEKSKSGEIKLVNANGETVKSYTEIAYDHIATQVIFSNAQLQCVKIDAKIKNGNIAYIKGAEDVVPEAIQQLGFTVKIFEVSELASVDLSQFQSVVLGIRIYNVHPELRNFDAKLFDYVKKGGNLVMQYNTASRRVKMDPFGPVPFELTRNRVTEEDAEVTFLAPNHPLLNTPNKITKADFENWVQERGLYFAGNWDKSYTPLFSWHDKGEDNQTGALIVTKYGEGQFVYTGISFFRELPNGVEGAYRLFANILSY